MSETDQLRVRKKMGKEKSAAANPFVKELFQLGVYKRSQGRIARQITFAAIWLLILIGSWRLSVYLQNGTALSKPWVLGIATGMAVAGAWIAYRLVNLPSFADFLIAVEAEMNKVSWPTRGELFRSSLVVVFSILFLATILSLYDGFWILLLKTIGVRP